MATYSRREIHTIRVEYPVPSGAYGACWVEVSKAVEAATQELVSLGLLEDGRQPADDAIKIRPGDEDVIVYFDLDSDYVARHRSGVLPEDGTHSGGVQ